MMSRRIFCNQQGFSLIEVLVSAVIFMIGFSMLIMLLNNVSSRFDIRDRQLGSVIADDFMKQSIAIQDTLSFDTILTASEIEFQINKTCSVDEGLAQVEIVVKRQATEKELIRLHNAFLITAQ